MTRFIVLILSVVCGFQAHARIFNFTEKGFGAHVQGSFGSTKMNQDVFSSNLGSGVSFSDKHQWMQGGQLGFALAPDEKIKFIFALEVLKPVNVDGKGLSASGVEMYSLKSSGHAINPFGAVELVYSKVGNALYFFGVGVGMGQVNINSEFNLTPAGQTALGVGSFTEKLEGQAVNGYFSFGMERHFVDTSTFVAQVGYRHFVVSELKHKADVTTIGEGSVSSGDVARNADGDARSIDLGGVFLGMGFRFYIP